MCFDSPQLSRCGLHIISSTLNIQLSRNIPSSNTGIAIIIYRWYISSSSSSAAAAAGGGVLVLCRIFYLIVDPTFVTLAGIPLLLMDVVPRINNIRLCLLTAVDAVLQTSAVRICTPPSLIFSSAPSRRCLATDGCV